MRLATDATKAELPPRPTSKLVKAVIAGDLARVKVLVKHGASVSEPDRYGGSPLHRAAVNDHAEIVAFLLSHGALLEARGTDEWTALHLACVSGAVRATAALVKAGADVNSVARSGRTPLHLAVIPGKADAIGANPGAVDDDGNTPAAAARSAGRIDLAELIESVGHKAV